MKRDIHEKLQGMIEDTGHNDVIMIEGARQVGKSYLVDSVLKSTNIPYLSFDLEKNAKLRREISKTEDFFDFQTLMKDRYELQPGSILFLDEAQECLKLAEYIKSFKEDWKDIKVILTGSSMNRFFTKETRIPVGRTRSICVFGFNFPEFVKFTKNENLAEFIHSAPETVPRSRHDLLMELYDEYITTGGYPEAVKAYHGGHSPRDISEEILASLEEDFQRKEAYQPGLFSSVLKAVADHIGSPSKYTHIDATKYYAKQVIEDMKAWHIILEVSQYSLDPGRSDFLPKRYLHDIGAASLLRSMAIPEISLINTIDPLLRTPLGGLFENAVLINLLSGDSAFKKISTWKKKKQVGIEVDFILDSQNGHNKIPIECKATTTIKNWHIKNVIHYLKLTNQTFGIVVSAAPYEKIAIENKFTVLNLPIYLATKQNIESYFTRYLKLK